MEHDKGIFLKNIKQVLFDIIYTTYYYVCWSYSIRLFGYFFRQKSPKSVPKNVRYAERLFLTRMIKLLCIFRLLIIKVFGVYIRCLLLSYKIKPWIKHTLLLLLIASACILPVHGQESNTCIHGQSTEKKHPGYSQTVYFRFDKVDIDSMYTNNRDALHVLGRLFTDSARVSLIDSIHIYAYSSPEGKQAYNEKLAVVRAGVMKDYLINNYPLLEHCSIYLFPQGENWEGLKELVEQDENFSEREEVLMILDKVQDSHKRERLIKRLNGGTAYRYIRKHILPLLRNAMVCSVCVDDRLRDSSNLPSLSRRGKGVVADNNTSGKALINRYLLPATTPNPSSIKRGFRQFKTNLAAWAAGCVNLAYETQTGKHFSIDIPVMWSSWDISQKHALRIIAIQPEFRYWLTTPGKGHFFGVHANAARYNLKWNKNRYQDVNRPLLGGGVSYGYSLPFNETWGMEFNLGAGYANTRYNVYHNTPNVKDGQLYDTRTKNYWGITRVGVSFIYKLPKP